VLTSDATAVPCLRRSERAAAALASGGALAGLGKSSWQLQWVTPDAQGRVEEAGAAHVWRHIFTASWVVCSTDAGSFLSQTI
jgi:hypothetical protein